MSPILIGRARERDILDRALLSGEAELVALYGRRRVGKTYLIREHLEPRADLFLMVTGLKDAPAAEQLLLFQREVERVLFENAPLPRVTSWREAFEVLAGGLELLLKRRSVERAIVFLDELPWLSTPRSGLLQALDHVWNTRLSRIRPLCMVLCGSAASWMIDKLIHAKGGLHNRITHRIHLQPFTLREAMSFLEAVGLRCSPLEVADLYLAVGGVPHYLRQFEPGRSAHENIGLACFSEHGLLRDEFDKVFASLFDDHQEHEAIIRAIAKRRMGVTRSEILELTHMSSGGRFARRLVELEQAGFISSSPPYRAKTKNTLYRLTDEYCWFYLSWIERAPKGIFARGGTDYWMGKCRGPGFRAWAGYAFEGVCLKHAAEIRNALGIAAVPCEIATWRHVPPSTSAQAEGAQVDLLFDREDGVIHLCELKYAREKFTVTKSYARELKNKMDVFQRVTRTKKKLVITLICTLGLHDNAWSRGLVERVVEIAQLVR